MVYLRVKKRVMAMVGEKLSLGDVADVMADARLSLSEMNIAMPRGAGIWPIDALQLIVQIQEKAPDEVVNVLGDGTGWLHRETKRAREIRKGGHIGYGLRAAAVCLLLAAGSALAIAWFHADVNMADAQNALYKAVAGGAPAHPLLVALPYALGMAVGVALYYALIGRKTVSPLTVKLREYREDVEKNAWQGGRNA